MSQTATPHLPANVRLLDILSEQWRCSAIEAVAYHNLASLIGDGEKTTKELAEEAGLKEEWVYRVLRFLSASDIFAERPGRIFRNTELSNCLREEVQDSLRAMAMLTGTERLKRIWADLSNTMRTGKPAMEVLYSEHVHEYFSKHPEEQALFSRGIGSFSRVVDNDIVQAYADFGSVKRLVDVGGGSGTLLATILTAYSHIQGVLFECPEVIELAAKSGETRFEFVSGDFFREVSTADTFILKQILHTWPDEQCIEILSKCVASGTGQGTRVLVCEQIITENKNGMGAFVRGLDLLMGLQSNGRERTREEFQELFAKSGLHLARVIPTSSPFFILEGLVV
jgi:hypothetical protein